MRASIDRSGTVSVPLEPEKAFRLFTPEGERDWLPGWSPEYPMPGQSAHDPPKPCAGMVFVTPDEGDEPRTWTITRYDPDAHRVSYSYVRPGKVAAMIDVAVDRDGQTSVARVRYRMTALDPGTEVEVRSFGSGFQNMLAGWSKLIRGYVADRP